MKHHLFSRFTSVLLAVVLLAGLMGTPILATDNVLGAEPAATVEEQTAGSVDESASGVDSAAAEQAEETTTDEEESASSDSSTDTETSGEEVVADEETDSTVPAGDEADSTATSEEESTDSAEGTEPAEETETTEATIELTASVEDANGTTVANVTVEAAEGVIPEGAALVAELLTGEKADKAAAELNEAGVEYDGYMALDIHLENDKGEEVEPDGEVRVVMVAPAALPEEADPATVAVQHHEELDNGEVKVEQVASAVDAAQPAPVALSAANDVSDQPAAGVTADNGDVTAEFAVESFSTFTVIWEYDPYWGEEKKTNITFHCKTIDEADLPMGLVPDIGPLSSEEKIAFEIKNEQLAIDGYTFDRAEVNGNIISYIEARYEIGWNTSWYYYYDGESNGTKDKPEVTLYYTKNESGPVYIQDDIINSGRLNAMVSEPNDGEKYTYTWYRNDAREPITSMVVSGSNTNIGENWLNVALDIESLCMNADGYDAKNAIRSATYTYTVKVTDNEGEVVGEASYTVPYYAQLLNGGFEKPEVSELDYAKNGADDLIWKTTGTDPENRGRDVELNTGGNLEEHYRIYQGAPEGEQVAELNAEAYGALYQDVLTVPGSELNWQLYHSARLGVTGNNNFYDGSDVMYVLIMSKEQAEALNIQDTDDVKKVIDALNAGDKTYNGVSLEGISATYVEDGGEWNWNHTSCSRWYRTSPDGEQHYYHGDTTNWKNSEWSIWRDVYDVPEDQYLTRFFFVSYSSAYAKNYGQTNTAPTVGNLLDNVWFSPELPKPDEGKAHLEITKELVGVADADKAVTDFEFTLTGPQYPDGKEFTLSEDNHWRAVFSNIQPGEYTITEKDPAGALEAKGYTYIKTTVGDEELQPGTDENVSTKVTVAKDTTVEVTFTNQYDSEPQAPDPGETTPAHSKMAVANENAGVMDGTYDLSLSVTGNAQTQGSELTPINVLFVMDASTSMKGYMQGEDGRQSRLYYTQKAMGQMLGQLTEDKGFNAKFSLITFNENAKWLTEKWTNDPADLTQAIIQTDLWTNYKAALEKASEVLGEDGKNVNAETVVVFLSDGEPNRPSYDAMEAAKKELSNMTGFNKFYTVGVGSDYGDLAELLNSLPEGVTGKPFDGSSESALNKAFEEITQAITYKAYSNVLIEDAFSDYVDVVMADSDPNAMPSGFEIVVKNANGDTPATVTQEPISSDGEGVYTRTVTLSNGDQEQLNPGTHTITATYNSNDDTLKLEFPPNYKLENNWTYEVHIDIQPNDAAKNAYIENDYKYEGIQNSESENVTGTAPAGTGTHGNNSDVGFYSNESATLTYTNQENARREIEYDRPVIQLKTVPVTVTKTFNGLGSVTPPDGFTISVKDDGSNNALELKRGTNTGTTWTWTLNLLADDYTFAESYYAVSSQDAKKNLSTVTVAGLQGDAPAVSENSSMPIELGNLEVSGDEASKSVSITNTYVDADGDLKITKTLDKLSPLKGETASFVFQVTNKETNKTYHYVFTFAAGETSKEFTFQDLPAGTYTVKELSASGYTGKCKSASNADESTGNTISNNVATVEVSGIGTATVTFSNESSGNKPGDNDYAYNQFTYKQGNWVWNRSDGAALGSDTPDAG